MEYRVNNHRLSYSTNIVSEQGQDLVMLEHSDDLTKDMDWHNSGFSIEQLFTGDLRSEFSHQTKTLLQTQWRKAGFEFDNTLLLDRYHTLASTWEKHLHAVEFTKLLSVADFPIDIKILENRISEILGINVEVKNPFDDQRVFHFRVIRPKTSDNNPLHRDVWLPDYKDCINLYIPIAGSNENSSLILCPGSHWWPESAIEKTVGGAVINNVKYNVPAVTKILREAEFVRPNPKENEVLIFSPYLIHGGASNLNEDQTRISIEIRLWRKA